MNQMMVRLFSRPGLPALLVVLAGCSNGASGATVCPCAVGTVPTVRYTGSFVSGGGQLAPPIAFTGTNETATVTVTQNSAPVSNLSVSFIGPCSAATLGTPTSSGTFTVTSVASGTCTIQIGSPSGGTAVGLSVP
jgi:hypothetical protein